MSALTIDTAHPGTRLRLTTRGRRVFAALAAIPATVALTAAILSGGSALASGEAAASTDFETVTVLPGQSLWAIAEQVAPTADPRDVIDAIVRLNALDSVTVAPGDQLALPPEYVPAR